MQFIFGVYIDNVLYTSKLTAFIISYQTVGAKLLKVLYTWRGDLGHGYNIIWPV